MTPEQIDIALAELETRIDRLRALYEQYFMGIERLEPSVPRKDVDRRFHELRKVPFRNTARRFKFQTLVQRYSTMQQYWQRICREIENGTYKRHKLRAERTILGIDPFSALAPQSPVEGADFGDHDAALPEAHGGPLVLDESLDTEAELRRVLSEVKDESKTEEGSATREGKPGRLLDRLGPKNDPSGLPAEAESSGPHAAHKSIAPFGPARVAGTTTPPVRPPLPPLPGLLRSLERPQSAPLSPTSPNPAASSKPSVPPPLPPRPSPRPNAAAALPPPRGPSRTTTDAVRPPHDPGSAPAPRGVPARPAEASAGLSAERIRAIHESYLDARRQTNATPVSLEKMERNLREQEQKLRTQHQGRRVDFEVLIKDGKAILKPKLG